LNKNIERIKRDLEKDQHRYEKIERALAKAKSELNEANVKKCKKYKLKYETKIIGLKRKLELTEKAIAKLKSKKPNKAPAEKTKDIVQPAPVKINISTSSLKPTVANDSNQAPQIKLPYPVLNDTRDMKVILQTLETRLTELGKKMSANKQLKTRPGQPQLEKIIQLEKSYESQKEKLVRQIEYIQLSLRLRSTAANTNDPALSHKLNEIYQFMKNENRQYLKANKIEAKESASGKQQQLQQLQGDKQASAISPKQPTPTSSKSAINQAYETLIKSLVTVLAHTAACAHSTASISTYNYNCFQHYLKQDELNRTQNGTKIPEQQLQPAPLPLKAELQNASSVFNKYKSKISNFFEASKKLDSLTKEIGKKVVVSEDGKAAELTGLNKLLIDYSDNDEETPTNEKNNEEIILEDDGDEDKNTVDHSKNNHQANSKLDEKEESEQEDESDSEWEIWTTSEIRQNCYKLNETRNYLLPPVKSLLFPLKASLDVANPGSDELVAIEKSKHAITFLGTPMPISDPIGQKRIKLADIL
jgi:hypothetical protein